ncbi:MAG: DUF4238 domain-containing protein, partial [Bacillota bacterium]
KNIFHETDMYTIERKDGVRILTLEHGLSGLESKFSKMREKLLRKQILAEEERLVILAFIAATFSRTKQQRNHLKDQWGELADLGQGMKDGILKASPEHREKMASVGRLTSDGKKGLSLSEVKEIANQPMQKMLYISIKVQLELFLPMNLSFLLTENSPGFITSDAPCVWFDPEAYKKPAFYRLPGVADRNIEITLPLSPNIMALLSWRSCDTYINLDGKDVDNLNRRTRVHADEYIVVNCNYVNETWFD